MEFERVKRALKMKKLIESEPVDISEKEEILVKNFINEAKAILNQLKKTKEEKRAIKIINLLGQNLNIPLKNLKKAFNNGLNYFIRTALKVGILNKRKPPQEQRDNIRILIEDFAIIFQSILKKFQRERKGKVYFDEDTVLRVKIREGLLSPQTLRKLKEKFPQVRNSVIEYSAFYHPDNSEKFIENFLKKFQELKTKYKDVDELILEYIALLYPDKSDEFIQEFLKRTEELIKRIFE